MTAAAPKRHSERTLEKIREKRLQRIPETFSFAVTLLAQDALTESRKPLGERKPVHYRHGIDDERQARRLIRQIGEFKACLRSDWNSKHPLAPFGALGTRLRAFQTRGPVTGNLYWELELTLFFDPVEVLPKTT